MAQDLDELFGKSADRPRPRLVVPGLLLASGLALSVLGMPCSSIPGVVVVLVGWNLTEREAERVSSGYFPEEVRWNVTVVRRVAQLVMAASVVTLMVQLYLLCGGYLEPLWGEFFLGIRDLVTG